MLSIRLKPNKNTFICYPMRMFLACTLIISLLACSETASEQKLKSWIFDHEELLTPAEENHLDSIIRYHVIKTSNEIAIVTTPNYGSDSSMFDYSLQYGEKIGLGKAGKNNGVLIAISAQKRSIFIHNGYGIENVFSDWQTKQIIDSLIIPHMKNASYFEGLRAGTSAIIAHLEKPENRVKAE